jgi:arabinan endo-1,5-alpha-L-arabinosidase
MNSRRIMLIDRIEWRDGWPWIGTPSEGPRPAPVASVNAQAASS